MHIEKVKERLSELARISEEGAKLHPEDSEMFITDKEALETALNYINNSISNDKIREKIATLEYTIIKDRKSNNKYFDNIAHAYAMRVLQDLLKME